MSKEKALSLLQNRTLLWLAKLSVLGFSAWYIYYKVSSNENFNENFRSLFSENLYWPQSGWLLACFLLMPFNWFMEAKKWQTLITPIEKMSLAQGFKSVLTGLALGFISEPHLGSLFGRVWQIQSKERFRAIGASILNSFCQNYVTAAISTYGLFYLLIEVFKPDFKLLLLFGGLEVLLFAFLTGAIFKSALFVKPLARFRLIYPYVKVLSEYSKRFILRIIFYSLVRFATYMLQFILLLEFFGSELNLWASVACVSLMYGAKSILPSFSFLSELGIREFTALYFFGLFYVPESLVIASTLTLWAINVLLPAIAGFYFAWNLKALDQLFRKKPKEKDQLPESPPAP